ncbi:MAG: hypothetical protein IJU81_09065 [Bacteroidales bacterium]|nr:hypothetical protein [Bacteroidales bacterium]
MREILLLLALAILTYGGTIWGQEKQTVDTIECPVVGFNFGTIVPGGGGNDGMRSLYKPPYLSFGLDAFYKYSNGWIVSLDGNLFFGNDNLKDRMSRMPNVYTRDSIIVGTNGTDAVVTCYNRGISVNAGVGRVLFSNAKNPNSGMLLLLKGGWLQNQTIFMQNDVNAPQIDGDYAYLYDHQRRGFALTEGIGYWFMGNHRNLANFYITLQVSQCWTHSTRNYVIDDLLGLRGADNKTHFDMLYTLKLCWMFPLKGKTTYDYYYY